MKAVIVDAFTPFDQARYGDLPDPAPGSEDVVIDVAASDVNFPDILYIEGKYQKLPPFPFSPGLAAAGRISALGTDVRGLEPGQRVLALPYHGSYAEKLVTPAAFCFPLPDHMPLVTAAAFGLVYQTAYFALTARAGMQRGDTVLVLGPSGGIGMASIQLARALGAGKVIAATRRPEEALRAADLGADMVVDINIENLRDGLRDAVLDATGGHGADVVIDPVGGDVNAAALRAMAWSGRMVIVGFASGNIPKFAANYLLVKNISISGIQWTDYRARRLDDVRKAQAHINELWSEGKLDPGIAQVLPLAGFADALRQLSTARVKGKIILTTETTEEQAP